MSRFTFPKKAPLSASLKSFLKNISFNLLISFNPYWLIKAKKKKFFLKGSWSTRLDFGKRNDASKLTLKHFLVFSDSFLIFKCLVILYPRAQRLNELSLYVLFPFLFLVRKISIVYISMNRFQIFVRNWTLLHSLKNYFAVKFNLFWRFTSRNYMSGPTYFQIGFYLLFSKYRRSFWKFHSFFSC